MKYPKTLADAIKVIKKWETDYCELNNNTACKDQEITDLKGQIYKAGQQRREAVELADTTRKNFEDLKERLHNSEMENARLRGYMERVREDDAVADPLVEIEGPDGKRFVSKRHPSPPMQHYSGPDHFTPHLEYGRERRKHWTSY